MHERGIKELERGLLPFVVTCSVKYLICHHLNLGPLPHPARVYEPEAVVGPEPQPQGLEQAGVDGEQVELQVFSGGKQMDFANVIMNVTTSFDS